MNWYKVQHATTASGIRQGCWKQAECAGTSMEMCCLGSPVAAAVLHLRKKDPCKSRGGTGENAHFLEPGSLLPFLVHGY